VLDSAEPEFFFDERGDVAEVTARTQTEAHRVVEHLMIAANESVARLLSEQRVPCLYRVHERPDPAAVVRLVEQLSSLEVPTPPMPEHPTPAQATELTGEISRLVDKHVRRTGRGRTALGSLVLRSLKQAYYSPRNAGHAGLRSSSYCHFTSPIRRYPDLVVHRALLSTLGAGERPPPSTELAELGAWTSEREREAMEIEREADDVASCFALERILYGGGWEQTFAGEVVGLIAAGAFVAFGAGAEPAGPPVFEGLLPARRLRVFETGAGPPRPAHRSGRPQEGTAGDWWELNELGTILRGQRSGATLRLGDAIEVRVSRVEPLRGRVDLVAAIAEEPAG
jgi:ribonuclease R